ncbi:MAG: hypothetical protein O7G32_07615 [SAR324 cluster bacterium]|nr:hypothetical protein [SAR324 cluster bacterium]
MQFVRQLSVWACWLALSLLLAACTASGTLKPTGGGLAGGDAAAVSAVVAQTRAQFPALSAGGLAYTQRDAPAILDDKDLEAVLRGSGVGVSPGVQKGDKASAEFTVFLDKPAYSSGYVKISGEISKNDGAEQTWRVVAYEHRGGADEDFEFLYLLRGPGDELRHLAIIGGAFTEGKEKFLGIEGTLVLAGRDGSLKAWQRAFKIDFGQRMPLVPEYQGLVEEAVQLFSRLRKRVPGLESLRARSARAEQELEKLTASPSDAASQAKSQNAQTKLDELRTQYGGELSEAESIMARYFVRREKIAGAYAAFTATNQYTWALPAAQQGFFDTWKEVETHHPRIDDLARQLVGLLDDPGKVNKTRAAAMDAVKRNNNWGRNPEKLRSKIK